MACRGGGPSQSHETQHRTPALKGVLGLSVQVFAGQFLQEAIIQYSSFDKLCESSQLLSFRVTRLII